MKRFAEQYLSDWQNRSDRKPLIVRGARQVGKTHLVEHWGHEHYKVVVKLDLERERDFHTLFDGQDPRKLLEEISLLKGQRLIPGECLLFLDEVQACPKALSVLRYFHEIIPQLHVIAAGSLLDFALREFKHSMPVGRIEYLFLHPMSFEEFLLATEGEPLVAHLQNFHLGDEVNEAIATRIKESLRRYFFIGGMPEAVHASAQKAGLMDIQRIQSSMVQTMQDDFAKYGTRLQQDLLRKTFRHVAQHVGRKIKYVNISRENRSVEVKTAFGLARAKPCGASGSSHLGEWHPLGCRDERETLQRALPGHRIGQSTVRAELGADGRVAHGQRRRTGGAICGTGTALLGPALSGRTAPLLAS
jgi:hypothetical protein